jgi:transposase-like protein
MEGTGVHKRPVRPQSFLRSPEARTLNHREIASLSEERAFALFKSIRFAENQGEPFCPHCGCVAVYTYKSRPIFKCQGCEKQFSLTSGTVFSHRKMSISDILYAIAEFIEGAKGVSAMYLQRKFQCDYRTAWVLEHKLREAMS